MPVWNNIVLHMPLKITRRLRGMRRTCFQGQSQAKSTGRNTHLSHQHSREIQIHNNKVVLHHEYTIFKYIPIITVYFMTLYLYILPPFVWLVSWLIFITKVTNSYEQIIMKFLPGVLPKRRYIWEVIWNMIWIQEIF